LEFLPSDCLPFVVRGGSDCSYFVVGISWSSFRISITEQLWVGSFWYLIAVTGEFCSLMAVSAE